MTLTAVSRGDIFLLREGNAEGAEIRKTRPCVIIQNDIGNVASPVTIVACITSFKRGKKLFLTNVFIAAKDTATATGKGLEVDSVVLCNQIYTVDKKRLIVKLGRISDKKMREIDFALIRSLDLNYTECSE